MKHIDIIPNYSGITGLIADGEISPNFLVKSSNDGKVHFSNAMGYQLVVDSGDTLNMYKEPSPYETNNVYVPFTSAQGFGFVILKDGAPITADFDYSAIETGSDGGQSDFNGSETGVTHFAFAWEWSDVSWEVTYFVNDNLVQVIGRYTMTDEETCVYKGGTWDEDTQTCMIPCEAQGMCDDPDNPGECIECDPCGGDPECMCNQDEYAWWDGESCHNCQDEWESLGYSSAEECACDHRGNFCDSGSEESGGETSE